MSEIDSELAQVVRVDRSGRRRYRERFKRALVERCLQPGASVSKLSIEAGINTNLVRKWVRKAQLEALAGQGGSLLPVVIDAPAQAPVPAPAAPLAVGNAAPARPPSVSVCTIEIELGAARIRIHASAEAAQLGAVITALKP